MQAYVVDHRLIQLLSDRTNERTALMRRELAKLGTEHHGRQVRLKLRPALQDRRIRHQLDVNAGEAGPLQPLRGLLNTGEVPQLPTVVAADGAHRRPEFLDVACSARLGDESTSRTQRVSHRLEHHVVIGQPMQGRHAERGVHRLP